MSRGKLITEADYKMLCYEHFGDDLETVDIKKGTMNDVVLTNGIVRTIDIHIKLIDFSSFSAEEIAFLKQDLLVKLKQNSANIFPFRVFIQ